MDTTQLIAALNARRTFLGMSQQQLADVIGKDVTSVSRQLSPSTTGMQLATLLEYAEALGGEIQFITDEAKAMMNEQNLASVRLRMAELGSQNDRLREKLDEKDDKIRLLETMYYNTNEQLERLASEYVALVTRLADKL